MDSPVYYGNSMRSVFTPGERLQLRDVSFAELHPGDIVAVETPSGGYVHRIIKKTPESAVTMGDNNLYADEDLLLPDSLFKLVVGAVRADGAERKVVHGWQGMKDFKRHQWRTRIRFWSSRVISGIERTFFWRIKIDRVCDFGAERCYFYRNTAVARRTSRGRIVYRNWLMRVLFRLPSGEKKT